MVKEAAEPALGKKEQALLDARTPKTGTTLGELMARRQVTSTDVGPKIRYYHGVTAKSLCSWKIRDDPRRRRACIFEKLARVTA
jgi:hypothetical protein